MILIVKRMDLLESASELDNSEITIIKYYLEEYFGIDIQMKVIDLEFQIVFV
jgi:hypothetical protein